MGFFDAVDDLSDRQISVLISTGFFVALTSPLWIYTSGVAISTLYEDIKQWLQPRIIRLEEPKVSDNQDYLKIKYRYTLQGARTEYIDYIVITTGDLDTISRSFNNNPVSTLRQYVGYSNLVDLIVLSITGTNHKFRQNFLETVAVYLKIDHNTNNLEELILNHIKYSPPDIGTGYLESSKHYHQLLED